MICFNMNDSLKIKIDQGCQFLRKEMMYDTIQNQVQSGIKYKDQLMIFILISRQFIMSIAEGKLELQLMRGYEESFRQRMLRAVSLSYQCLPLNMEEYSQRVGDIMEEMKLIDPNEKQLGIYDEIILGKIEGQPATTNFKLVVESVVGEVSEEKFKAYLKQKSEQRNFGATNKDKNCSIRQVKKLQSLKKYFDFQQIVKKRKYNKLFSSSIKSLAKFFDLYDKIDENQSSTILKAFEQYNNYSKDQKKLSQFTKEHQQRKNILELPPIAQEASLQKQIQEQAAIEQEKKIDQAQQDGKNVEEEKRPHKQEAKTPKKHKTKKKQSKPEGSVVREINSGQITEKDKCQNSLKKDDKQKQSKDKQKQKTVKKVNNKLLTEFFVLKKKQIPQPAKKPTSQQITKIILPQGIEPQNFDALAGQQPKKKLSIWDKFGKESYLICQDMSSLRQQFRAFRMQNEQYNPQAYYTNIVITLSTIQYYDYLMQINHEVDFGQPFKKIQDVMYFEDESEEFEGESANGEGQEEDQEEEDELSEGNHTILSDDHLSNEELSSYEADEIQLKVEYGKGRKWVLNFLSRATSMQSQEQAQICNHFQIIFLQNDQNVPLRLDQEQQTVEFLMTAEMWRDAYKLVHGYYGTKEAIIKDLSALLPGVSKNWIDGMLKERSEKVVNQRFIKKDFIDDLKEKVPQIDLLLQKVLEQRNQQLRKIKAEKNQQKDLKLQKDILECTGSCYIVNLIKQLKQKGYKQMRRNQLIEFIQERKGEEWDKIKIEMNTMSRPIDQLIRNMPAVQRIDEEVEVDDEEYKRMQVQSERGGQLDKDGLQKEKSQVSRRITQIEKGKKKKGKKREQAKGVKNVKMKKRKDRQKNLPNIYEKTKVINRGRKTKNSLKTGILSIEQLQKKKEQEKCIDQNQEQQQGNQQGNQQQSQHQNQDQDIDQHERQELLGQVGQIKQQTPLECQDSKKGGALLERMKNGDQQLKQGQEEKISTQKQVVLGEQNNGVCQNLKDFLAKCNQQPCKFEKSGGEQAVTFSSIEHPQ